MHKKKPTAVGRCDGTTNIEQASSTSKDIISRRRSNFKIAQNIPLIWLNKKNDDNSIDYQNTVTHLQTVGSNVNTFTNTDRCIDFLTDNHNKKAVLIISGSLCRNTVPLIHDIDQLDVIFILCKNQARHEQWATEWPKIKGVFTEITPICQSIAQAGYKFEQDTVAISFMAKNDIYSKTLDQLDCSFVYIQILKEILLAMKFAKHHIKEFSDYCREVSTEDKNTIVMINEFEQTYCAKAPTWWYTRGCFLYSMLNRALRLMDMDIIIKMAFFIYDLHRHIEQLHYAQFNGYPSSTAFMVYRGQGVSNKDFEQMQKTNGGLMSFNKFLSTSRDRDVSLAFAESNMNNPDLVGILFIILTYPSISATPFASITDVSYFQKENELLFSIYTIFRIRDIKPMCENNRLFQVHLTLTNDNDQDVRALTSRIREEVDGLKGWYRLSQLAARMGQFDKVGQIYAVLLEQSTVESEKASIYRQLGWVKGTQGAYEEAITFYENALEIDRQRLPPNHRALGNSYNNIGILYYNMDEYSKALFYYEKALKIRQIALPPSHPDLGNSYNNIGAVYYNMGEHSKVLSYYEKALEIRQKVFLSNHPDLGASYYNIGMVYYNMGNYSKALSYYENALKIRQKILSPNHPDLDASYNNIGNVYANMGEYSKALLAYEKALEIKRETLSPDDPDLGNSYNNIGAVYCNVNEHSKALFCYEKALEIKQRTLPPNHPDLGGSYNNIGNVYDSMGEYSKALSYYEKALDIGQKALPSNHPHLGASYNNIGTTYESIGNYTEARAFYELAVDNGEHSLPPNHPTLKQRQKNLDKIKTKL